MVGLAANSGGPGRRDAIGWRSLLWRNGPGGLEVKQRPGGLEVKQRPGGLEVKQRPGRQEVKQTPGRQTCAFKLAFG